MIKQTSTFNRIWAQCAILQDEKEIMERLYKWATPHERWCITRYLNRNKGTQSSVAFTRAKALNLGMGASSGAGQHLRSTAAALQKEEKMAREAGDHTLAVNNKFLAEKALAAQAAILAFTRAAAHTQEFYRSRTEQKKGKKNGQCT